ncbi:MAG: amidase, partial [Nitriliruptorales bacterium]
MPADTVYLTAVELLERYATGELSPVEATQAALDRIEEVDDRVNAFCLVDGDRALEAARRSESRWKEGRPDGLLDGVPVAIKDVFLTVGWPTRKGSAAIAAAGPWDEDAPPVARLREHEAVPLGKTTTPELGWKGVTDSPLTGVTGNPWDPTRTAGGSSGGSAAAVALGMAPLATGTDGGGSIRIPAGFSGIAGLKPTFGRVPHYPPSPFGTLAHAGPMAWTVADVALMLDVMVGPDARDWQALPPPGHSFTDALGQPFGDLRVAYSETLGFVEVDPEVAAAVGRAAEAFEALGATVEAVDPGFADPVETYHVLWYAAAAKALESFTAEQRSGMD